jgi:tetratricopeptide (TPR) repeat protein
VLLALDEAERHRILDLVDAAEVLVAERGAREAAQKVVDTAQIDVARAIGKDNDVFVKAMRLAGEACTLAERFGDAAECWKDVVEGYARTVGKDYPLYTRALVQYGGKCLECERSVEAGSVLMEAIDCSRSGDSLEADKLVLVVQCGRLLYQLERYREAATLFEPLAERLRASNRGLVLPARSRAIIFVYLAMCGYRLGDLDAAREFAREAYGVYEKSGEDVEYHVLLLRGRIATMEGKLDVARNWLDSAEAHFATPHGREYLEYADVLLDRGAYWYKSGMHDRAADALRRAVALRARAFGEESTYLVPPYSLLAEVLREVGDPAGAMQLERRVDEIRTSFQTPEIDAMADRLFEMCLDAFLRPR